MKEIKFRAWDKEEKKIYLVYKWALANHDSGAIKLLKNNGYPEKVEWQSLGSVELMQYTGLKDKNDKEIYEGDIVRYGEEEFDIAPIVFSGGAFCIKIFTLYSYLLHVEIIGNVYENPELLTS